jgi:hypothetical protein
MGGVASTSKVAIRNVVDKGEIEPVDSAAGERALAADSAHAATNKSLNMGLL